MRSSVCGAPSHDAWPVPAVPDPIGTDGGLERFSRDEIVDWLRDTGRGNNGEAALDAPALSAPAGAGLEDLVTLLCLRAHGGEELSGTSPEERDELARGADPHDEFMLREVRAAGAGAGALDFVDELVEASFGGEDALARLERGRLGRQAGARDLTSDAIELVRTLATACALHVDPEGVPLVTPVRALRTPER